MIRVALIGCGEHSRSSHAAPLARYAQNNPGEIELIAACDLSIDRSQQFCDEFGFARSYTDMNTMLSTEQIDACVSVMPMELIVPMGIRLLELNIPCVIEKPLGISPRDAERLADVARHTGTPHMISVNRRFMPYLNEAKSWALSVGPLQYVRATQIRHARSEHDFIWSTAIHVLDALRHLAGEVIAYHAEVETQAGLSATWYVISLRFQDGTHGRIEVLPTAGMVEESYELFGEGFRTRVVAGAGTQRSLECWRNGRLELEKHASDSEPEDLRNGSYEEVVNFVKALRNGKHLWPTVEDILPSAQICFAIADSVA